ncbi:SDR family oxidoreductase [Pseudomonas gingeri]|uniref:SDR family NAD(P)-dependent oxidoreductase n=1 Tax=Pseudomonas gingeri TaxID=117681 RepID=UPI0015A038DC|nr:SDR family oxidoreductase [Pseudomonas gingeri]NVZ24327.1 SDR family oxidoreductase [Pseudomonas gingeri]
MELKGKTAFITGGNSGIGLATARLFVSEGARVVITGRNPLTLEAALEELGPQAMAINLDVTDIAAIERAVQSAVDTFGRLDVVFANAGISGTSTLGKTTIEAFEAMMQSNLTSVFFTVQAAAEYLNPGASIILNGSVHAKAGAVGFAAYAATKGAVRSMTRVLASELAPRGIRVNQVTPGAARTPIWDAVASTPESMAVLEARLLRKIPLGRLGEAEEVARGVLFLAGSASSNVTGQELVIDGGATGAPCGAPVYR